MKTTFTATLNGKTYTKTTSMKLTHVVLSSADGENFTLYQWSQSEANAIKAGKRIVGDWLRLAGKTHFFKVIEVI